MNGDIITPNNQNINNPQPSQIIPSTNAPGPQSPSQEPAQTPSQPQPKNHKKLWLGAVVVLVIIAAGAAYALNRHDKKTPVATPLPAKPQGIVLNNTHKAASKYNRSNELMALGNVSYKPEDLKLIAPSAQLSSSLSTITPVIKEDGLSGVAFLETGDDVYTRRLIMYDFSTKKAYVVTEDKGDQKVRHYYHPVILSDHYVAWYTLTYDTPVDLTGSINVVDLSTGQKTELLKDKAGNLPESLCCSVSPDGLYLVVPQPPNKIAFYSAGGTKTQEITVNANILPKVEGQDSDAYAAAQRAGGYPALQWLGKKVVLATNAPLSYKVDKEGTHISKATNGIDLLDLETNQQTTLVKTGIYSIPWFEVTDKTLVFASHTADETLAGGPITGKVNLFTMPSTGGAEPKQIPSVTHDKLGALVLDKSNNILYLQEEATTPITAINIADNSQKKYSKNNPPLIDGALDADNLTAQGEGDTPNSSKLYVYKLSTNELRDIY